MTPTEEAVRLQLLRIVDSATFRSAARLRAFLRHVVDETFAGRAQDIKEYSIGRAVCGRPASFDPKLDPIVRVDASRLRSRLEGYYANEGLHDPVYIELPKGAYVPLFSARSTSTPSGDTPHSLVVLPFVNLSPSPEQEYLCDGLTEELIHSLARVRGLRVIARSSSFLFKTRSADARQVAAHLQVKYVLEGSLRIVGPRLRVTAQLIDATSGWLLWSEKYESTCTDILAMQDEIAASITDALKIQLTPQFSPALFLHASEDPEAYSSYLRGRYYWNQRTPEALSASLRCFEQALAHDPACAPAHAGMADTLAVMALNDQAPTLELLPRALAAASRALELRPGWPEALTSLGFIQSVSAWDWQSAARNFQEAIQRQPGHSAAHYLYGVVNLAPRALWAEAIHSVETALQLDPVSPVLLRDLGLVHFMRGSWDDAESCWRQAESLAPNYFGCLYWRARLLIATGKTTEALAVLQSRLAAGSANTRVLATIAYAHARAGDSPKALAILDELTATSQTARIPALDFATIWLGLGDAEQALHWLENAWQEKAAALYQFGVDPLYDPIRNHPRGLALRKDLGLPLITPS